MENIKNLVENLYSKDNKFAYENLKLLLTESERSNSVYNYFDRFTDMIEDKNSYIRSRGIILISANAKWDKENKIEKIIDGYLKHIMDEKPITARQCIKVLPDIAKYKPNLVGPIREALIKANAGIYPDTMKSLIYKDIASTLEQIKER
ncbi:MAG TPA: SufBD protein [Candidatus Methanofastidiosum sp.]|nr:SufBD protein [Methanofastidiosum sp.]